MVGSFYIGQFSIIHINQFHVLLKLDKFLNHPNEKQDFRKIPKYYQEINKNGNSLERLSYLQ